MPTYDAWMAADHNWDWIENDPEAVQLVGNWSENWQEELPALLDERWPEWSSEEDTERLKTLMRAAEMPFFEEETIPFFDESDDIDPSSMTLAVEE